MTLSGRHAPTMASAHFPHRRRGADVAEHLAVGAPDRLPVGDVGHEHPGTHHVFEGGASGLEGAPDVLQGLHGLGVGIPHSHHLTTLARGGRAGHMNVRPDPDGAGVPDDRLPRCAAADALPLPLLPRGICRHAVMPLCHYAATPLMPPCPSTAAALTRTAIL